MIPSRRFHNLIPMGRDIFLDILLTNVGFFGNSSYCTPFIIFIVECFFNFIFRLFIHIYTLY